MCVGEFYEMLDSLPEGCDGFDVRFTTHNRSMWIYPDGYHVDNDGGLCINSSYDGDGNRDTYTVEDLKELLSGDWDNECVCVNDDMDVYAEYCDYDENMYCPVLNHRFWINRNCVTQIYKNAIEHHWYKT